MSVHEREEPAPTSEREELAKIISKSMGGHLGITRELAYELADAILAQGFSGRSPAEVPPNWPDAQRLNWLEGTGESYCNRDRIDRFGAEWLSFDSGAALDANDPTGTHKNIRDAIDAAAGSAAEVPPNEILELCNLVLGGFNEDGDYNGDTKYILALCAAVWRSAQPHD